MIFSLLKTQWRAMILMVAALCVGLAFAVGHDALYQSLNGQPVRETGSMISVASSLHVSDQQIYVSLGTFFAFIVKALLGYSVSRVFDQFAWHSIQGRRTQIGIIDNLLCVLANGFMALKPKLWRRYPASMVIAGICWLLPLASIVTPATLNVQLVPFSHYVSQPVPRVDFTSANFVDFSPPRYHYPGVPQNLSLAVYNSPMPPVQRIVNSAATEGAILSIKPGVANASWILEFDGPALQCKSVNQTLLDAIVENVQANINASKVITSNSSSPARVDVYGYLSWVPGGSSINDSLPFMHLSENGTYIERKDQLGPKQSDGSSEHNSSSGYVSEPGHSLNSGPGLSIFVATFPNMLQNGSSNATGTAEDPNILSCGLFNASYVTNFTYENGAQHITVKERRVHEPVSYIDSLEAFPGHPMFIHNASIPETFSYQSIMDAFGSLLVGSIINTLYNMNRTYEDYRKENMRETQVHYTKTNVMSTVLMNTEELQVINAALNSKVGDNPFTTYWDGRSFHPLVETSQPLSDALEDMFQNITFSMMSSKYFQPNYTVTPLPNVNVTFTSNRNIYSYSRPILWVAYGIAIGVTCISVAAGVFIFLANRGSFTTQFSTILRVTYAASVNTDLNLKDCNGLDPLPKHIAKAQVILGGERLVAARTPTFGSSDESRELRRSSSQPGSDRDEA